MYTLQRPPAKAVPETRSRGHETPGSGEARRVQLQDADSEVRGSGRTFPDTVPRGGPRGAEASAGARQIQPLHRPPPAQPLPGAAAERGRRRPGHDDCHALRPLRPMLPAAGRPHAPSLLPGPDAPRSGVARPLCGGTPARGSSRRRTPARQPASRRSPRHPAWHRAVPPPVRQTRPPRPTQRPPTAPHTGQPQPLPPHTGRRSPCPRTPAAAARPRTPAAAAPAPAHPPPQPVPAHQPPRPLPPHTGRRGPGPRTPADAGQHPGSAPPRGAPVPPRAAPRNAVGPRSAPPAGRAPQRPGRSTRNPDNGPHGPRPAQERPRPSHAERPKPKQRPGRLVPRRVAPEPQPRPGARPDLAGGPMPAPSDPAARPQAFPASRRRPHQAHSGSRGEAHAPGQAAAPRTPQLRVVAAALTAAAPPTVTARRIPPRPVLAPRRLTRRAGPPRSRGAAPLTVPSPSAEAPSDSRAVAGRGPGRRGTAFLSCAEGHLRLAVNSPARDIGLTARRGRARAAP
ncbi:proline-rich protein 2-like [Mustela nigripes]|uniref:proline-rich protein 2-like n=1 Tax=Mustela nigripes TaxID=77151 RepID=UPI00281508B8|nr:proline-rich protein 2-like [Mustela nigripes]